MNLHRVIEGTDEVDVTVTLRHARDLHLPILKEHSKPAKASKIIFVSSLFIYFFLGSLGASQF